MTTQEYSELRESALAMDFERVDTLLATGLNLNCLSRIDKTLLTDILDDALFDRSPHTSTIARELLKRGADPNFRNSEQRSALHIVMLNMATDVLRLLLEAGANTNDEQGFDESESFYDYAEFDYRFQVYDLHLPEET
jgi:ankyrin repeat protein